MAKKKKELSPAQIKELINILKTRFEKNMHRHKSIEWKNVLAKLEDKSDSLRDDKLRSLYEMERTGGEPDVVSYNKELDEFVFFDCSPESPIGRRSICYDADALNSRKENKPANSALGLAAEMGIEVLTEKHYRDLQKLGRFDAKTSSWILTPPEIRKLGGAIFADYRYGTVFVYHNGAESYYAARGFRGLLHV